MVLFVNINLGQTVQVLHQGQVLKGVVKYKGGLANVRGDWVGVELDQPAGKHNGMYKGRQYFTCKHNHGAFVHPSNVRFNYLRRSYFDTYRTVSPTSEVDDTLFHTSKPRALEYHDPRVVSEKYSNLARDGFENISSSWHAGRPCRSMTTGSLHIGSPAPSYNKGHSISCTFRPSEKPRQRPQTAIGNETFHSFNSGLTRSSSPYRLRRSLESSGGLNRSFSPEIGSRTKLKSGGSGDFDIPYATSPSMPKIHMPYEALQLQNSLGWEKAHKPREWLLQLKIL